MIEHNKDMAVENVEKTTKAGDVLQAVLQQVQEILDLNRENSQSAQEQNSSATEMSNRTASISAAGDKNAEVSEHVNALTDRLSDLSAELQKIISTYRL